MKKKRFIFLLIMAAFTLAIYTLVLGEVGYIKRQMLRQELVDLKQSSAKLSSENSSLNEQYHILKKRSLSRKKINDSRPVAIILKFEDSQEETKRPSRFLVSLFSNRDRQESLQEARIIFVSCMLLLTLIGYTALRQIEIGSAKRELIGG